MTSYKQFIEPPVQVGATTVESVFAADMAKRLRIPRKALKKAGLADWEDEGGSVALMPARESEP